ncbi:MAG: hypothetical protein QOI55_2826, partial [Actinomycetota bacterium]|nr:hypothetical protein [Actinomycetota bacterium]
LRHTFRDWLDETVVDDEVRNDMVLAASELAAAAIRAVPAADAAVAVRAWVDNGSVVLESRAEVGDHDFVGRPSKVFEGNDGERGFSIVAALSDVFAVKGMPSGVVVRARMARERFGTSRQG